MHRTEHTVHEAMGAGVPESAHAHLGSTLPAARNGVRQSVDTSLADRIAQAVANLARRLVKLRDEGVGLFAEHHPQLLAGRVGGEILDRLRGLPSVNVRVGHGAADVVQRFLDALPEPDAEVHCQQ